MAFYGWLQKHTGFLSQQNFAVNPKLARQAGWGSQVLDNFIAPQALALAGKQIAFAGRLSTEKGHDRLPEIAASLGQVIDVYGDGDRTGLEECTTQTYTVLSALWHRTGKHWRSDRHPA